MKVDVLALGMLSCLRRGLDLLREHYGKDFRLPPFRRTERRRSTTMLSRADSVGVFQVESRAQMSMLPRLKPQCFYDLVIEVAIVRPGPIQGDMVHPYLRRRDGIEKEHPLASAAHGPANELAEVLKRTLGVPLFQEQAMQIAITAAKFTPDEADGLRRAMATFRHTGKVHLFRDKFINGMAERGYDRSFAEHCFGQIEGFGEYGFPESHAASFALLVYASAWIKCRYPDVFCAAILNSQPMGFYQPAQLVRDARAARRRDPRRRRQFQRLGLHARTERLPLAGEDGWGSCGAPRLPPDSRSQRRRVEKAHRRARQWLCLDRAARRHRRHFPLHHRTARRGGCVSLARPRPARGIMGGTAARHDRGPSAPNCFSKCGCRQHSLRQHRGNAAAAHSSSERRAFPEPEVTLPAMPLCEHVVEDYVDDRPVAESASRAVFPRPPRRPRRYPQ